MMTSHPDTLLTPREHDVMNLVARGESDGRIALLLGIAPWTALHYVRHACVKLGAANRAAAAVRYAGRYWPPPTADAAERHQLLSPQEGRVLDLIAEGLTDQQIGAQLNVTVSTIRQHLLNARRKLGVPNRTAAAVEYYRQARLLSHMKKTGSDEAG